MPHQSSRDLLMATEVVVSRMACGTALSTNKVAALDTAGIKEMGMWKWEHCGTLRMNSIWKLL